MALKYLVLRRGPGQTVICTAPSGIEFLIVCGGAQSRPIDKARITVSGTDIAVARSSGREKLRLNVPFDLAINESVRIRAGNRAFTLIYDGCKASVAKLVFEADESFHFRRGELPVEPVSKAV